MGYIDRSGAGPAKGGVWKYGRAQLKNTRRQVAIALSMIGLTTSAIDQGKRE
jgi:hypothetical protein